MRHVNRRPVVLPERLGERTPRLVRQPVVAQIEHREDVVRPEHRRQRHAGRVAQLVGAEVEVRQRRAPVRERRGHGVARRVVQAVVAHVEMSERSVVEQHRSERATGNISERVAAHVDVAAMLRGGRAAQHVAHHSRCAHGRGHLGIHGICTMLCRTQRSHLLYEVGIAMERTQTKIFPGRTRASAAPPLRARWSRGREIRVWSRS
eukprot:5730516-Prymnesium_polylepis.1